MNIFNVRRLFPPKLNIDPFFQVNTYREDLIINAAPHIITSNGASIVSWMWEQIFGNTLLVNDVDTPEITIFVSNNGVLLEGAYRFKLTVTDSNGLSSEFIFFIDVNDPN